MPLLLRVGGRGACLPVREMFPPPHFVREGDISPACAQC